MLSSDSLTLLFILCFEAMRIATLESLNFWKLWCLIIVCWCVHSVQIINWRGCFANFQQPLIQFVMKCHLFSLASRFVVYCGTLQCECSIRYFALWELIYTHALIRLLWMLTLRMLCAIWLWEFTLRVYFESSLWECTLRAYFENIFVHIDLTLRVGWENLHWQSILRVLCVRLIFECWFEDLKLIF
jgi:hypothetical protein